MYDKKLKITNNFTLGEFTKSETADKLHIDNHGALNERVMVNLGNLCTHVLQPLRERAGIPIFISSGFRCPKLNKAVKGSSSSQHVKGEAADIYIDPKNKQSLFDILLMIVKTIEYDQLIWETRADGRKWIHVSYVTYRKNRKMKLKCEDGKTYKTLNV